MRKNKILGSKSFWESGKNQSHKVTHQTNAIHLCQAARLSLRVVTSSSTFDKYIVDIQLSNVR